MEPEESVAAPVTDTGRIAKATSMIGAVRIPLLVLGIGWRYLSLGFLGSESVANAFNWSNNFTMQLSQMWEKFLRPTVIPMFMQESREHGEEAAWRFASTVINLLALAVLTVAVVGIVFAPQIVDLTSQYTDEQARLASQMLRWMLLAVPLLALSVMGYLMLNSYKRFGLAALGDLALKAALVVGLVGLYRLWGWPALVTGLVSGSALKFAMYFWGLRKENIHYRPVIELTSPAMKRFYILVLPLVIGALVALGRDRAEDYFRTGVEDGRAASIVSYGRMPVEVPIQVIMLSLGIAIFPFISEASAKGRHRELFEGFFTICRGILILFIPITVGMITLRTPFIHTLFEWGKFNASDTILTSETVFYYAFGYVPLALEMVLLPYFYARKNTLFPTVAGVVASVLNILFLWWLLDALQMSIGAFTLAVVVTKGLKVAVLIALLKYLFPEEHNWGYELKRVADGLARVLLATAVMFGVMWTVDLGLNHVLDPARRLQGIIYLAAITAAGCVSYLSMVVLLRVEEVWMAIRWVRQKIGR